MAAAGDRGGIEHNMQEPLMKERLTEAWHRSIYAGTRRTSATAKSSDPALETFFAEDGKKSALRGDDLQKLLESKISTERERELFFEVRARRQTYVGVRKDVYALKVNGDFNAAGTLLRSQFLPASDQYLAAVSAFLDFQKHNIDSIAEEIQQSYHKSRLGVCAAEEIGIDAGFSGLSERTRIDFLGMGRG